MIRSNGICRTITLLMTCAALLLVSCIEVPGLSKFSPSKSSSNSLVASTSKGHGPPDHAPAWGYRRKHGGATVMTKSEIAIAETAKEAAKNSSGKDDDDNSDKTKLLVAGAAIAAGTVYAVVNERDKARTKAQTEAEIEQIRQEMNVVTVNVTNRNGSINQVRLQKQGIGYVGPKGEFYDHLPTEEELKPVYAL
jgi:hypothetical protein